MEVLSGYKLEHKNNWVSQISNGRLIRIEPSKDWPLGLCLDNKWQVTATSSQNWVLWGLLTMSFKIGLASWWLKCWLPVDPSENCLMEGFSWWRSGGHTNLFIRCISQFTAKDWLLQPTHVPWPFNCWLFWGGCSPFFFFFHRKHWKTLGFIPKQICALFLSVLWNVSQMIKPFPSYF